MKRPLADAGLLIALLNRSDRFHAWGIGAVAQNPCGFATCEAVLAEVFFQIDTSASAKRSVLAMLETGWLIVLPIWPKHHLAIARVLERDHPNADLADACVVALHEAERVPVWTTDRRDFTIYRTVKGLAVDAVFPAP